MRHLFFTVVNQTDLRVYRKMLAQGAEQPAWTVIYTAKSPDTHASMVWLTNIDADNDFVRKLMPDTPVRQRSDPEIFFTQQGPYLYFNRADQSVLPAKQEGVYRTHTGLPALVN